MKTVHFLQVTILFVTVLLLIGRGITETVRCPRYCMCYLNTTDNMRTVSCVARRLDSIDLAIPKRVQSLNLSNNSISVIEDRGFQNLGLIEIIKLVLSHNSIRTIGLHSFAGLTYLQWVDLSANSLYQILPWTFHDNSNLNFISLSGNPLGHILPSGPLLDLPSLEVLELSNCNFAHLSQDAFLSLPNLRRLDLSHNQLISFDIHGLQFLYHMEEINVNRNPWKCNTNLQNLKEFLGSRSARLLGSPCDLPRDVQDIQIKPARFEKIISVGTNYPEYNDSNESGIEDDSNAEKSDEKSLKQKPAGCTLNSENKTVLTYKENFILPPVLLIIVSFQLGVCTTLLFGYFWVCCTRKKKEYQSLNSRTPVSPSVTECEPPQLLLPEEETQTILESPITVACPETPPPSYRDLFINSNS